MTIEVIGIIIGISASVSAGILYTSKEIKKKFNRRWKKFEGEWTNKMFNQFTIHEPTINLKFEIDTDERLLIGKGIITFNNTKEVYLIKCWGKLRYSSAVMKVSVYFCKEGFQSQTVSKKLIARSNGGSITLVPKLPPIVIMDGVAPRRLSELFRFQEILIPALNPIDELKELQEKFK